MNKFLKFIISAFMVSVGLNIIYGILHASDGNFFRNAGFMTSTIMILLSIVIVYFIYLGIKKIWTLAVIGLLFVTIQGCSYAKSNQQVLVSSDCGMTWKKINAGDAVPRGTLDPCYMRVVVPNFPMQGESKFIGNLSGKVKVNVEIDYDYSITDGLAFIKEAKYLGRANADVDDNSALDNAAFESAENRVIEKRIREVAKGLFLTEDIVDMEQADLEEKLENESNKILDKYGVKLNFMTLTFIPDDQTKEAIDVATAMRIYESKNLKELGEKVISARAGATKVSVETKNQVPSNNE